MKLNVNYIKYIWLFVLSVAICMVAACSDDDEDPITVVEEFRVRIIPNPINAIVKINGEETYSIKGVKGTEVEWSVEQEDCIPQNGSLVIDDKNLTIEVNLQKEQFLFEIIPNPIDASVTINGEVTNSLMIGKREEVEWSVAKTGYITQTGKFEMLHNESMAVVLEIEPEKDPDAEVGSTGLFRYQNDKGELVAYRTVRAAARLFADLLSWPSFHLPH